jgi:hypothetical protein
MESFFYIYEMNIVDVSTDELIPIEILPVEKTDYKFISKNRYFFNWIEEQNHEVLKLIIKGKNDILGLISYEDIPEEWRFHVRLLTVSKENKGANRKYSKIAGNLIVHLAKLAIRKYGIMGCVSLRPKTQIAQHYIKNYKMKITGMTLSLEVPEILDLINQYENE